jgi:hypothetical protein
MQMKNGGPEIGGGLDCRMCRTTTEIVAMHGGPNPAGGSDPKLPNPTRALHLEALKNRGVPCSRAWNVLSG